LLLLSRLLVRLLFSALLLSCRVLLLLRLSYSLWSYLLILPLPYSAFRTRNSCPARRSYSLLHTSTAAGRCFEPLLLGLVFFKLSSIYLRATTGAAISSSSVSPQSSPRAETRTYQLPPQYRATQHTLLHRPCDPHLESWDRVDIWLSV